MRLAFLPSNIVVAALIVLFAGAIAAAVSTVSNPFYDKNATSGGLQDGCDDFAISANDVLSAKCNKVTAGIVSQENSSLDLTSDTAESCQGGSVYLKPRSDRVLFGYKCVPTRDKILEIDLNDMVKWEPSTGDLVLRWPG